MRTANEAIERRIIAAEVAIEDRERRAAAVFVTNACGMTSKSTPRETVDRLLVIIGRLKSQ